MKKFILMLSIMIFVGCNSEHGVKVSVENETPQRTIMSLSQDVSIIDMAPGEGLTREQIRVISWLYLQQAMENDYALRLQDRQVKNQQAKAWFSWIAFLLFLSIITPIYLYLFFDYRLKRIKLQSK